MREKDKELLEAIDAMAAQAPELGICSLPFKILRDEVGKLIAERDELRDALEDYYGSV